MKIIFAPVLLCLFMMSPRTLPQAGAPQEAFFNVFQVRGPAGRGTVFTMAVDGRQYFVTAKHMVAGLKTDGSPQTVEVLTGLEGRRTLSGSR
jgi:hypothetical protein